MSRTAVWLAWSPVALSVAPLVGKVMASFWGAVMTLALVFGVASVALANGQPFLPGRATNAATVLTNPTT